MSELAFYKELRTSKTANALNGLGLTTAVNQQDLIDLFYLIDAFKEGRIRHDKFLACLYHLDGLAKSIYVYCLLTKVHRVTKRVDNLLYRTNTLAQRIEGLADRLYEDFEAHFDMELSTREVRKQTRENSVRTSSTRKLLQQTIETHRLR